MAFAHYMYQITAAKGSGEYALRHVLEPFAWAREPIGPIVKDIKVTVLEGRCLILCKHICHTCPLGASQQPKQYQPYPKRHQQKPPSPAGASRILSTSTPVYPFVSWTSEPSYAFVSFIPSSLSTPPHMQVPVSFIYGESDWMRPQAGIDACELAKSQRSALSATDLTVKVVPKAGHFVFLDQPDEFHKALFALLQPGTPAPKWRGLPWVKGTDRGEERGGEMEMGPDGAQPTVA